MAIHIIGRGHGYPGKHLRNKSPIPHRKLVLPSRPAALNSGKTERIGGDKTTKEKLAVEGLAEWIKKLNIVALVGWDQDGNKHAVILTRARYLDVRSFSLEGFIKHGKTS